MVLCLNLCTNLDLLCGNGFSPKFIQGNPGGQAWEALQLQLRLGGELPQGNQRWAQQPWGSDRRAVRNVGWLVLNFESTLDGCEKKITISATLNSYMSGVDQLWHLMYWSMILRYIYIYTYVRKLQYIKVYMIYNYIFASVPMEVRVVRYGWSFWPGHILLSEPKLWLDITISIKPADDLQQKNMSTMIHHDF